MSVIEERMLPTSAIQKFSFNLCITQKLELCNVEVKSVEAILHSGWICTFLKPKFCLIPAEFKS